MSVDLGSIVKRLMLLSPLNKLSEDDKMIAAGQIGQAMREAIRRSSPPMTDEEIKEALTNPDAVMVSYPPRIAYDPAPVPLSNIVYAQERPCFTCGETISEATLDDGQMVTLDRDRVRHKLRCKRP